MALCLGLDAPKTGTITANLWSDRNQHINRQPVITCQQHDKTGSINNRYFHCLVYQSDFNQPAQVHCQWTINVERLICSSINSFLAVWSSEPSTGTFTAVPTLKANTYLLISSSGKEYYIKGTCRALASAWLRRRNKALSMSLRAIA